MMFCTLLVNICSPILSQQLVLLGMVTYPCWQTHVNGVENKNISLLVLMGNRLIQQVKIFLSVYFLLC